VYKIAKGNGATVERSLPKKHLGFLPEPKAPDVDLGDSIVTAVIDGKLEEVGYIKDGELVVTSGEYNKVIDDDSDLIDEDPDEDAQEMPDFIQESDDGHDEFDEDDETTPIDLDD